jgi:hypothetical protein
MDGYFPSSYEESRARFLREAEALRAKWPSSRLEAHPLENYPDLSIDWLWAEPESKKNLVMISTGEHGIEGYVGSAMLKVFMDDFAPRLDPADTGLLLVHAINPWGMKHRLRVNPNHVDLNRNFVFNCFYNPAINPDFDLLFDFLNPGRPVRSLRAESLSFFLKVVKHMIHPGRERVQAASLLGQYRAQRGLYFGGTKVEEETAVISRLFRAALEHYQNFLHLDMHTGYGPSDQMTVVIPPVDPIPSAEASQVFNCPLVQKIDQEEFYEICGDMGEYVYCLRDAEFPGRNVLAGGFEFGTFGDSLPALIRSLRVTVLENQLRHHGAASPEAEREIREEYEELFNPKEVKWREKALADARQAFEGILNARIGVLL